jgi:uncharacterized protein YpbB
MKVINNSKDKRKQFVKDYIQTRKRNNLVINLEHEFTALACVLHVSVETIRKDYYM